MRLLLGLLTYLMATVALVGGAAMLLLSAAEPAVTAVPARQEARKVAPRIQEWLDRKAEARIYAEREQAAALAEKKRVEALRLRAATTAEHAFARARDDEKLAAERESAAQAKKNAKREARKRTREAREQPPAAPRTSYGQSLQYYPDVHGRSQ